MSAATEQYLRDELVPSLELLAANVPRVHKEEIEARLAQFINTLHWTDGAVDPAEFPKINQYFVGQLIPYFRMLDDQRAFMAQKASAQNRLVVNSTAVKRQTVQGRTRQQWLELSMDALTIEWIEARGDQTFEEWYEAHIPLPDISASRPSFSESPPT